jgi:glutathione synthase/RimK-type ligase-like ATP-grasp enzyme
MASITPVKLEEDKNLGCFCVTLDSPKLEAEVRHQLQDPSLAATLFSDHKNIFSRTLVFVSERELEGMLEIVTAIEAVAKNPSYQKAALAWAPAIAAHNFGPRGVFMGYDFHLSPAGPKLIEINTNAGGAFLNVLLAQAQKACCGEARNTHPLSLEDFEDAVWRMFLDEWQLQGRNGHPTTVAIVDDQPSGQYLFPEFILARRFFERRQLEAFILDPSQLQFSHGSLKYQGRTIDLVYNRLVDFSLEQNAHQALRDAYVAGAVVLTPNPRNHALLADKRNLTILSDAAAIDSFGDSPAHAAAMASIPRAVVVTTDNADELWSGRNKLFFKPSGGHGGKAVYRGDKVTRSVWAEIISGNYIAQTVVRPSERRIKLNGEIKSLKLDVRLYTYGDRLLFPAARIYQGQTTNFRTPGGGFAPVFST